MELRDHLNRVRESLNFSNVEQDPYEQYIRSLRKKFSCTRDWLKCMEILHHLTWNPQKTPSIFFNAELPGSFVLATQYYLQMQKRQMEWLISSYYPQTPGSTARSGAEGGGSVATGYYLGDTLGILMKNPNHSLVGPIMTNRGIFWCDGDLTQPKIPLILAELVRNTQGLVDLYTADGSIDTQDQEEPNYNLIVGEVQSGVRVLKPGGTMILKIFTFFTPEMKALLGYLMRIFERIEFFKPITSSPVNSEVYVLGTNFRGLIEDPNEGIYRPPSVDDRRVLERRNVELVQAQIQAIQRVMKGEEMTKERPDFSWI